MVAQSLRANRYKAFYASLLIHTALFSAALYFGAVYKKTPQIQENKIIMQLSSFVPHTTPKQEVLPQKAVQTPQPKAQPQPKKAAQKTLRKIPQKQPKTLQPTPVKEEPIAQEVVQNEAVSSEAFTPPLSEEVAQEVTLHEETPLYSPALQPSVQNTTTPKEHTQKESLDHTTLSLIRSMIQEALIYPPLAKRLKLEGVVVVSFTLTRDGRVEDALILNPSKSTSLDKRALQTVTSLSGSYPELPSKTTLEIPIAFTLKKS
jgi:TonB family protein